MNDHPAYSASEEETGHVMDTTPSSEVWRATGIAAAASLAINLVLFFVGVALDWIPDDLPDSTQTFGLVSVILASVIPVVLFGALMAYLTNHAPRAKRLFTIILTVVLVLAVMVPITLQDIDQSFQFTLIAMHIVTASCILYLTRTAHN